MVSSNQAQSKAAKWKTCNSVQFWVDPNSYGWVDPNSLSRFEFIQTPYFTWTKWVEFDSAHGSAASEPCLKRCIRHSSIQCLITFPNAMHEVHQKYYTSLSASYFKLSYSRCLEIWYTCGLLCMICYKKNFKRDMFVYGVGRWASRKDSLFKSRIKIIDQVQLIHN